MGKVRLDPEAWEDGRMHGESMRPILSRWAEQVNTKAKYSSRSAQVVIKTSEDFSLLHTIFLLRFVEYLERHGETEL